MAAGANKDPEEVFYPRLRKRTDHKALEGSNATVGETEDAIRRRFARYRENGVALEAELRDRADQVARTGGSFKAIIVDNYEEATAVSHGNGQVPVNRSVELSIQSLMSSPAENGPRRTRMDCD